ncbi:glucosaminidase domain-containing protein [Candidatus Roizmanbacteria bacterium]|nr:glucosaminidase domain-containing protein [Candidatus Roizmanbacteria bacterium]
MVKAFIASLLFVMMLGLNPKNTFAQVAGSSATMEARTASVSASVLDTSKGMAIKRLVIKRTLEKYHSPLVNSVDAFMNACQKYSLDCYLLPSITGLESTFGQFIWPTSYNPFGWGGGYIMFKSWEEGIQTVARGLRENYVNKGATDVESIGHIYSESPTWAVRVRNFMAQMERDEEKNQLFFDMNRVQL